MKILVLVGGISKDSINKQLFNNVRELSGGAWEFDEVDIASFPHFSQDIEENPPRAVAELKAGVKSCDGLLFVTPEYNRSIPGVLKNALDWGSRPYGSNCWGGKPAAIIGAAISPVGTFGAQSHLRQILTELSVPVMPSPSFYYNAAADLTGGRVSQKMAERLKKMLAAFAEWIEKLK